MSLKVVPFLEIRPFAIPIRVTMVLYAKKQTSLTFVSALTVGVDEIARRYVKATDLPAF